MFKGEKDNFFLQKVTGIQYLTQKVHILWEYIEIIVLQISSKRSFQINKSQWNHLSIKL